MMSRSLLRSCAELVLTLRNQCTEPAVRQLHSGAALWHAFGGGSNSSSNSSSSSGGGGGALPDHVTAAAAHPHPAAHTHTHSRSMHSSGACCSAFGQPPFTVSDSLNEVSYSQQDRDSSKASAWAEVLRNSTQQQHAGQHGINPCNSPLHPAVMEGVIMPQGQELPVQQAYTPQSVCFGCGPANPEGLHLESKRILNGLEAVVSLPAKYCAFPGVINGGIVAAAVDCHSNWTAAIALMDKAYLPRPPFTLTASMYMAFKEPTPPAPAQLILRSQVVSIKENAKLGKARIEVETHVYLWRGEGPAPTSTAVPPQGGAAGAAGGQEEGAAPPTVKGMKLLAIGQGVHKRLGALRAL